MYTYPRTVNRPWTWPRNQFMRFTSVASGSLMVCPYTEVNNSSPLSATDTVFYGDEAPGWRQRIQNHSSATTVLQGTKTVVRMPVGTASYFNGSPTVYCQNGAGWGHYTGYQLTLNDPGNGTNATADAKAKAKLLDSYLNAVNTWRGGNFLAEIRETIHMIRHPVQSFYNQTYRFAGQVKGIGKAYRLNPVSYSKRLADAWLAYVFGVKPLIQDANDAFKALSRLGEGGRADTFQKLRGSSRFETVSSSFVDFSPIGWVGSSYRSLKTVKSSYKVRYIGCLKTQMDGLAFQAVEFGVSLDDILPAIWEAIPWSFFIDYFLNVQEVLDGLRWVNAVPYRLDLNVRNVGVVQIGKPYSNNNIPTIATSINCGPAHSMVVRVNRTPVAAFPFVGFRFKFPGFPSLKWLNIAALSEQIRHSRPK